MLESSLDVQSTANLVAMLDEYDSDEGDEGSEG